MTGVDGDAGETRDIARGRFSRADIVAGLGAALAWATVTFVGLGRGRTGAAALIALGFASSSTVPVVAATRLLASAAVRSVTIEASALLTLVPIGVLASVIQTHTHHRALGAVTFTAGATLVLLVTLPITRRILEGTTASVPTTVRRLLGGLLVAACGLSAAWVLWTLLGSSSPVRVRDATQDGLFGIAAAFVFARMPAAWVPRGLARVAPALLVSVLGVGVAAAWKNAAPLAFLCERAPVTLGIPGLYECR